MIRTLNPNLNALIIFLSLVTFEANALARADERARPFSREPVVEHQKFTSNTKVLAVGKNDNRSRMVRKSESEIAAERMIADRTSVTQEPASTSASASINDRWQDGPRDRR